MNRKVILASGSPRRHEILEMAGVEHVVMPASCDESAVKETDPKKLVYELSRLKAYACLDAIIDKRKFMPAFDKGYVILASDTVVAIDGEILGKPASGADAFKMIKELQGRIHHVYTGVTLLPPEDAENDREAGITFVEATEVKVAPMTDDEIEAYVKTGEPMDKAGAYAIQGIFCKFVESINGDYYTVMGLPIAKVYSELKKI
ncbi:MAG: septum formation protein Maf [Lachnospiraceae bacterium]|nr:septum formation protein Maf [Lachnospiraceae bacterium]